MDANFLELRTCLYLMTKKKSDLKYQNEAYSECSHSHHFDVLWTINANLTEWCEWIQKFA